MSNVLRQMIDNNKPHWRPDTIRGAHKQLNEYEAKAKAWDRLMDEIDGIVAKALEGNLTPNLSMSAKSLAVSIAKKEYESGESIESD